MTWILAIAFLLCIIFYEYVGSFLVWILSPIINNPVGAIFITFLIVIALARIIKIFMSEMGLQNKHFISKTQKQQKKQ